MRYKTQFLRNLLTTTIFCGAVGIATPAFAQDNVPQTGPVEATQPDDEPIVVTGSRIPQPNLTSTSPVTVVNSQEVRVTGTTRAEDLINSLPQVFAGQSSTIANGASGTATLNLRGLGSERTLVLINGRRLLPGDPFSSASDINAIPAALISRVDVLTGGASSVYGADAVGGVVNFIMDTNFEGVRMDAQYSFYQHENGARAPIIAALEARGFGYPTGNNANGGAADFTLMMGAGFDDGRGHVTAYIGYRDIEAVLQATRDYSNCALTARTTAAVAAGPGAGGVTDFTCGGSATSANGTLFTNTQTLQIGPNRTFIPSFTPYNFGPLNHYQRPDERYVGGVFAHYEISPALKPYMEFMFMDDRTIAQIAPSGNFGATLTVNCDNPLLSAQQRAIVCAPTNLTGFAPPVADNPATPVNEFFAGSAPTVFFDTNGNPYFRGNAQILRRNVEGGGRQDTLQHTSFRAVAGMRGDLSDVWSYDIYYQFGRVNFAETYLNDFSVTRLTRAIDIVDNPNTPGVDPVCRSVLDGTDPNCVPWDIFATGQVTPASVAYLQTPGFQRGFTEQTVANASITGNLGGWGMQFPWASSGIGLAFGIEYRKEKLELNTDVAFQTGDLAGQGAPTLPIAGQYDVREAFGEVRIPIVEDNFIHELSLEAGYRYSDYGVGARSFSTDTYKLGGFFAPIRDIRFRATYNRAVRAPNIQDLFATQRVALNGSIDPCAGDFDPTTATPPPTATAGECALTGVTPAQYGNIALNPAEQYNGLIGGNPNLSPEVADTITLGVVIQPRFLPRFALTVDFFDIEIANTITQIGQDTILTTCIDTADPTFCGAINRDQFGTLWRTNNGFIVDLTTNIGSLSTRGIDVQASYSLDLGTSLGGLGFSFVGTWLDELVTDNGVSAPYDCVGFYGNQCGTPNPEWRHTLRLNWNLPDGLGLTGRWRYFSGVAQDTSSTNPTLSGATQPANLRIPSQSYIDLTLTARIGDHYAFRLGVNNLLDRDPPIIGAQACPAGICNGNAYTQVYDALGRYIFAGVTLDF